ncbi:MAG: hypothetical protein PHT75_03200 [Bacilli bacterium]|nr:hypothetical protein [Bacilli bacterium]MDD3305101.1 hypothetical protein [Bacilli bacterium]MDD4053366.1 hypothetical protein [Bacilli bacterium]MDD4410987.1 hypothetical protein [Bacilli bacterium]
MKLIKKFKWIILGFFILFIILTVYIGKEVFLSQDGVLYGNRLEGIKEVPIGEDVKKNISDLFLATEGVKKVSTNVQGRILYIVIRVDETITTDKIKEVSNQALTKCSAELLKFYDLSFLVDYEAKSEKIDFPIIGSKNKNSDSIIW